MAERPLTEGPFPSARHQRKGCGTWTAILRAMSKRTIVRQENKTCRKLAQVFVENLFYEDREWRAPLALPSETLSTTYLTFTQKVSMTVIHSSG